MMFDLDDNAHCAGIFYDDPDTSMVLFVVRGGAAYALDHAGPIYDITEEYGLESLGFNNGQQTWELADGVYVADGEVTVLSLPHGYELVYKPTTRPPTDYEWLTFTSAAGPWWVAP